MEPMLEPPLYDKVLADPAAAPSAATKTCRACRWKLAMRPGSYALLLLYLIFISICSIYMLKNTDTLGTESEEACLSRHSQSYCAQLLHTSEESILTRNNHIKPEAPVSSKFDEDGRVVQEIVEDDYESNQSDNSPTLKTKQLYDEEIVPDAPLSSKLIVEEDSPENPPADTLPVTTAEHLEPLLQKESIYNQSPSAPDHHKHLNVAEMEHPSETRQKHIEAAAAIESKIAQLEKVIAEAEQEARASRLSANSPKPNDEPKKLETAKTEELSTFSLADDFDGPQFVPFKIAMDPVNETVNCVRAYYECVDYPESQTSWPSIPTDKYKSVIGSWMDYTSPLATQYILDSNTCTTGQTIKLHVIAGTTRGQEKEYGGDYWLARLTRKGEDEYKKLKNTDDKFGTYIPGVVTDYENGKYDVELPCVFEGEFVLQLFLIRTSEAQEATKRAMAGINPKSRAFKGKVNGGEARQCGPMLPEQLPDSTLKYCTINDYPGREWYCSVPQGTECGNLEWLGFEGRAWNFGEALGTLHLDDIYEQLAYSTDITVTGPDAPSELIDGYWKDQKWYPQIERYSDKIHRYEVLRNKILVILGDSLSAQFMVEFKRSIELYGKDVLRLPRGGFKCTKQEYGFLGLAPHESCPSNPGPWAPNIYHCKSTNTTFVRLPHGLPIHKDGCITVPQYTGDMLQSMVKYGWVGPEYVLLMTHGAHFATFNPIVFYRRLIDIKQSVAKYKEKSPDSMIVFKTFNYVRGDFKKLWSTVSSFNAWRQREMVYNVLSDAELEIFDVWPMTSMAFDHMDVGNVHPGWGKSSSWLLEEIINYFTDFLHSVDYI